MEWINIHAPTLRAPEYIGSDPTARATWFNVLAYCCEQENSGRIIGGAAWKDRQWQQTCGVTLKEVQKSNPLLTIDGDDVCVWRYPEAKEIEVQQMRALGRVTSEKKIAAARLNGSLGGRPSKPTENPTETQRDGFLEETQETQRKPKEGNGREGKGKEVASDKPKPARKTTIADDEWLASLQLNPTYAQINVFHEAGKAKTWILANPGRQFTRRFFVNWLNRAEPSEQVPLFNRAPSGDHPRWRDFLSSLQRGYVQQQFAPEHLRDDFAKWKQGVAA